MSTKMRLPLALALCLMLALAGATATSAHELKPGPAQQAFINGPAGEIFFLDGEYAFGFVVERKTWLEPLRQRATKEHRREHRLEVGMRVRGRTSDCIGFDADEYCNLWQVEMNECTFRVSVWFVDDKHKLKPNNPRHWRTDTSYLYGKKCKVIARYRTNREPDF